jgi:hypothetical protein
MFGEGVWIIEEVAVDNVGLDGLPRGLRSEVQNIQGHEPIRLRQRESNSSAQGWLVRSAVTTNTRPSYGRNHPKYA